MIISFGLGSKCMFTGSLYWTSIFILCIIGISFPPIEPLILNGGIVIADIVKLYGYRWFVILKSSRLITLIPILIGGVGLNAPIETFKISKFKDTLPSELLNV